MDVLNLYQGATAPEPATAPGFHQRESRLRDQRRASPLPMTVLDLAPGATSSPHHYVWDGEA